MELLRTYFWDTYALYGAIDGRLSYSNYKKDVVIMTTKMNLMELHYILLSKFGKEIADHYYSCFSEFAIDIDDELIKKANGFRLAFKNRKFSYIDCLGYIMAKLRGAKFLTGDSQFKDLENVEFVR